MWHILYDSLTRWNLTRLLALRVGFGSGFLGAWIFPVLPLAVGVSGSSAGSSPTEEATVVVYARHTFRGVSAINPPGAIQLPEVAGAIQVPMFAYGMDASEGGLRIAQHDYPKALRSAVRTAIRKVGVSASRVDNWESIRADLATQRTFQTAFSIHRGMGAKFPLIGCATSEGRAVDPVTSGNVALDRISDNERMKLAQNVSPEIREAAGRSAASFLQNFARSIIGIEIDETQLARIGSDGADARTTTDLATLAATIEMGAVLRPSIRKWFDGAPKDANFGQLVSDGLTFIASRWELHLPPGLRDVIAWGTLSHIAGLPPGSRRILVGHDQQLYCILSSLRLISFLENPTDCAIYPMESLVVALTADRAAVVRMQLTFHRDGTPRCGFRHRVVWEGSRKEWDRRLEAVQKRIQANPVLIRLRDQLRTDEPVRLELAL